MSAAGVPWLPVSGCVGWRRCLGGRFARLIEAGRAAEVGVRQLGNGLFVASTSLRLA